MSEKDTWTERVLLPQVTEALQQIAADNGAIKAAVEALVADQTQRAGAAQVASTTSATPSTFLTSWAVDVTRGRPLRPPRRCSTRR